MATFVDELVSRLELDTNQQSFAKGQASITATGASLVKMAGIATTAILTVQGLLIGMANSFADGADVTNKFAKRVGTTVENVQELDYVAESSAISIESMHDSMEKMFANSSKAAQGNKQLAETFAELGINAKTFSQLDASDQFDKIALAIEKVPNEADRMRIAMEIFGRSGKEIANIWAEGSDGLQKMREDARKFGLFTQADADAATEYGDRLTDLQYAFKGIKNVVGGQLLAPLTDIIIAMRDFIVENREFIKSTIINTFKALGFAIKWAGIALALFGIGKFALALTKIPALLMLAVNAFKVLRVAALMSWAAMALGPILIGLVIAAIGLLIEDVYTFFNGGDSLLGRALEKWPKLKTVILTIAEAFKTLAADVQDFWAILKGIFTGDFQGVGDAFDRIVARWKEPLITFFAWIKEQLSAVSSFLGMDAAMSSTPITADQARNRRMSARDSFARVPDPLMAPSIGTSMSNATTNKSTQQNDNRQYNINGADIGMVKKVINEQNAYTAKTLNTGIEG